MQASHLKRLALYFDVDTKMWKPEEDWQQLSPQAWDDLFRPGIAVEQSDEPAQTGRHFALPARTPILICLGHESAQPSQLALVAMVRLWGNP